jgi:hypothetical protein
MGIDTCKLGKLCYNHLADPNNLCNDDHTGCLYFNPVEYIEFLIPQPVFSKIMSYVPAKEFNDAEECVYTEVKSSNL